MKKSTLFLISLSIVCVTTIVLGWVFAYYNNQQDMAEKGYEEVLLPGKVNPVWQKRNSN